MKSKLKKFSLTGKLIEFKEASIKHAIQRHFKRIDDPKIGNAPKQSLPDMFMVLGYVLNRSTSTGIATGELHLLGEDKVFKYHLAPQFSRSDETVEYAIDLFFNKVDPKNDSRNR